MSFPAYPSYQKSGVEWLGEVPSHWEVAPLKRLLDIQNGADHKHVEQEDGYPVIGSGGQFTCASDYLFDGESVLLGRKGTIDKPLYVTGRFWTVDTMYWSKIRSETNGRFAFYTATTIPFSYYSTNTALPSMTQTALNGHFVARPPLAEQVAIATFLDRETAKIDALIEEQRRLIALLKEKRQAVISHAVTKGLDPHAPMKDSGIEWLGQVPAHWEIKPLKHMATDYCDGPFGSGLKSEHYVDEGVRVIRLQNIREDGFNGDDAAFIDKDYFEASLIRHEVLAGDVLVAGLGDDRNRVGRACVAPLNIGAAMVKADCFRFRLTSYYDPYFVAAQLSASSAYAAGKLSSGSTRSRIPATVMAQRKMAAPPLLEQQSITAHTRELSSMFDGLAEVASSAIDLLIERRAALISAAVTGKIDVRGPAKVLPFPIERTRARGLIATEIIERSAHQATFGRVKFQKIAFLAEAHVGISELAGSYTREAAGPLDRALIEEMESGARSIAGIEREQPGGAGTTVSYRLGQQRGARRQELAQWLGEDRTVKLDKLIGDFAALSTKEAEAVATLYGVWNDALSEGTSLTDDEIISGFLNDWHPEKRAKFRASELPEWLGWMRRHGIVPTGSGPKTTTGRLFV